MKIKTTLAAVVLMLTPGFAFAMGCSEGHRAQSASIECGDGMIADDETNTCVPATG